MGGGTSKQQHFQRIEMSEKVYHSKSANHLSKKLSGDITVPKLDHFKDDFSSRKMSDNILNFNGVSSLWSQKVFDTVNFPEVRTGQFYTHDSKHTISIIGCGVSKSQEFLNDIWILELSTLNWTKLNLIGDQITPRNGSRGAMINNYLYVFGGIDENKVFLNDLYCIDITTSESRRLETTGDIPSPRMQPFFASYNGHLYVWGGFGDGWPTSLHELDLNTMKWQAFPQQSFIGRLGTAYAQVGELLYCYGSADTGGIIILNMKNHTFEQDKTSGTEPSSGVIHSVMVHVDNYLFLVGGKATNLYQYVYICDLRTHEWSILVIFPDNETTTIKDGYFNQATNLFMIPCIQSMSVVYYTEKRQILSFLGEPMLEPPAIQIIDISDQLAFLHLSSDMVELLNMTK